MLESLLPCDGRYDSGLGDADESSGTTSSMCPELAGGRRMASVRYRHRQRRKDGV
jgi:hypothetical protein